MAASNGVFNSHKIFGSFYGRESLLRKRRMRFRFIFGCMAAVFGPAAGWAQVVVPLPDSAVAIKRIVVSATPTPQSSFNVPGSIYTVTRRQISEANAQENLSESLNRVPGIDIQNRQNYAQGLRITSRGFGSQTSFGVRNVKIFVDGMPLTTPDGTADSSVIDLGDVSRIEVLSGPFSALYGNAAGGVLQLRLLARRA
jgi:iron complex outermembrane receptor protein